MARDAASLWKPLEHRDFRLLWAGFIVSHIGDTIQILAQSWLVVDLTRSAFKVGAVALAQAVPRLAVGLFAGVLVDRVDRRRLLLVTQSFALAQSAVFLALVATGRITYGAILVLALALGVFDSLNLTARLALMPSLIPRDQIARGVALQLLGVNVTQILGPSLGGLILGALKVEGCLVTNVVTFAVLIVALLAMRAPPPPRAREGAFADAFREGVRHVRGRPELWIPIALAYLLGLLGMPVARLLPLYARVVLDTTGRGYGFLAASAGVGALAASLLVTARARPRDLPRNIVVAGLVFALALGAFAWTAHYALAFAALVVFGGAQMAFRSAATTLLQIETPDRLRGRVISALSMDFALWSVGAALLGSVVDRVARTRLPAHVGAADSPQLPPAAVAWGLHVTLALAAGACALVVLAFARPLWASRDRIGRERESAPGPGP